MPPVNDVTELVIKVLTPVFIILGIILIIGLF